MLHASWRRAWANLMRLAIIRAERQQATDACMDDGWDGRCVSCLPACATASAICIARPNYRDLAVGIRLPSLYIHALMQMQMQMQLGLARERRCSCGCYSARSMTRVSWSMDRFNQGTVLSGTARGEPIIGAAHGAWLHSSAVVQRSISESCSLLSSFPSCSK